MHLIYIMFVFCYLALLVYVIFHLTKEVVEMSVANFCKPRICYKIIKGKGHVIFLIYRIN